MSIKSKTQDGYTLELLTKETMKLFERTESKITKNKNGEHVPHLEITEVVIIQLLARFKSFIHICSK